MQPHPGSIPMDPSQLPASSNRLALGAPTPAAPNQATASSLFLQALAQRDPASASTLIAHLARLGPTSAMAPCRLGPMSAHVRAMAAAVASATAKPTSVSNGNPSAASASDLRRAAGSRQPAAAEARPARVLPQVPAGPLHTQDEEFEGQDQAEEDLDVSLVVEDSM